MRRPRAWPSRLRPRGPLDPPSSVPSTRLEEAPPAPPVSQRLSPVTKRRQTPSALRTLPLPRAPVVSGGPLGAAGLDRKGSQAAARGTGPRSPAQPGGTGGGLRPASCCGPGKSAGPVALANARWLQCSPRGQSPRAGAAARAHTAPPGLPSAPRGPTGNAAGGAPSGRGSQRARPVP